MIKFIQLHLVRAYLFFKGTYIYNSSPIETIYPLKEMVFLLEDNTNINFTLYREDRITMVHKFGVFMEVKTKHYVVKSEFGENSSNDLHKYNSMRFSTGYFPLNIFNEDLIINSLVSIFLDYLLRDRSKKE